MYVGRNGNDIYIMCQECDATQVFRGGVACRETTFKDGLIEVGGIYKYIDLVSVIGNSYSSELLFNNEAIFLDYIGAINLFNKIKHLGKRAISEVLTKGHKTDKGVVKQILIVLEPNTLSRNQISSELGRSVSEWRKVY